MVVSSMAYFFMHLVMVYLAQIQCERTHCTQLFNPSIIVFITAAPVATRAFVRKNKRLSKKKVD